MHFFTTTLFIVLFHLAASAQADMVFQSGSDTSVIMIIDTDNNVRITKAYSEDAAYVDTTPDLLFSGTAESAPGGGMLILQRKDGDDCPNLSFTFFRRAPNRALLMSHPNDSSLSSREAQICDLKSSQTAGTYWRLQ